MLVKLTPGGIRKLFNFWSLLLSCYHKCASFLKTICVRAQIGDNGHLRDPKFVSVVDRWSLFRGRFMLQRLKLGLQNGGHCGQLVVKSSSTVIRATKRHYLLCLIYSESRIMLSLVNVISCLM